MKNIWVSKPLGRKCHSSLQHSTGSNRTIEIKVTGHGLKRGCSFHSHTHTHVCSSLSVRPQMLVGEGLRKSGQSFNNPLRRSFLIAGLICIRFAESRSCTFCLSLLLFLSHCSIYVFVKVSLAFQSLSLFLAAPRSQFCHFLFLIFVSLSLLIFIGDNRRGEILNKTDLSSDGFFSAEGLEFGSRRMPEESFPAAVRDKSLKWLHLHLQIQSAD